MADAKVLETLDVEIGEAWNVLGNFTGLEPGGGIESIEYRGEGPGMTRSMTLAAGNVTERLLRHDDSTHSMEYEIVNDDSPLPFREYRAVLRLTAEGEGTTQVEWASRFEPKGVSEDRAVAFAERIYRDAIARAREKLCRAGGDDE